MAAASEFRIALVIPRSGSPGIYGPSCKACVELAIADINDRGGIAGQPVAMVVIDGAQSPRAVGEAVRTLVDSGAISAVIGMHDSDVRHAIIDILHGRIPYIYAANYEGDGTGHGVVSIGLTAAQQIRESVAWLAANRDIRDWLFIGNDYVWPRGVARTLKDVLAQQDLRLLGTEFVALGEINYAAQLNLIEQTRPDAVFAALVGADAIAFNRQFVRRGLDRTISRFLPLFEENSLLAVGTSIGKSAFTAGTFFADTEGETERRFQQRYETKFGNEAPQLNGFAVSCYEAAMLLSVVADDAAHPVMDLLSHAEGLRFPGIVGDSRLTQGHAVRDVLLAEAVGRGFAVRAVFPQLSPDGLTA